MVEKIGKLKYVTATITICLSLTLNFLYWHNLVLGIFFTFAYLLFFGFVFGSVFLYKRGWQMIFGPFFLLCLISIIGAILIYFYKLNGYTLLILLYFIPILMAVSYFHLKPDEKLSFRKIIKGYIAKFDERRELKINFVLVIIYAVCAVFGFYFLFAGQTVESIQEPWQVVSSKFFLIYFVSTIFLITYLLRSKRTKLPLLLVIIHSFLSTGIALIVYKIGFGFDPFIHQATEKIIGATGTILPKPLYYLGQYSIVIFLHKFSGISISLIDKVLVPGLFSIYAPLVTFYVFSNWLQKKYSLIMSLMILIIPYSGFIMTTPQNLANLIFIMTILLSLLYFKSEINFYALYLLGFAALAVHPLAGIPLLITIALLNIFKLFYDSYKSYIGFYFLASASFIIFLPLSFVANGSQLNLYFPKISFENLNILNWVDKFDLPLNIVYLISFNKIILALLIIIFGFYYIAKNKLLKNNSGYLTAAFVIFIDFLIVKYFITFPALIDYDKNSFTSRLLVLTFYILLPFFLLGIYVFIKKIWESDEILKKIFLIFILSGGLSISLYLSYPRLNQYEPAKFFSLSESDIKAVTLIEQVASPNHIVLANQMIGAAAIKEFGFKKYYNNQFYYSMPMGQSKTLYEGYLEMIYQGAKRETMQKAMREAGVNESYFVLNKYWRNFEKIADQASASAEKVYTIDNGNILIFKYQN